MERCKLTDQELKDRDIKIDDAETDASFFNWIDNMIEEEFKDIKEQQVSKQK